MGDLRDLLGDLGLEELRRQANPRRTFARPGDLAAQLGDRTSPALDLIDDHVTRALATESGRLIVAMPPQEGKSQRLARVTPVWWLLTHPSHRVGIASYGQRLADSHATAALRLMRQLPHHPTITRARQDHWDTMSGGGIIAAGRGAGLTGHRLDMLIIDDPLKSAEEAASEGIREKTFAWWQQVLSTRLSPAAPVILIMTRWHQDDLAGRLIGEGWPHLTIPARSLGDGDPLSRPEGVWLDSVRGRTPDEWEKIEQQAGPDAFQALYQGAPTPPGGGIFKSDWWQWWDPDDPKVTTTTPDGRRWCPPDWRVITSWDLALTGTGDYVAGQVWAATPQGHFYLLDLVHARLPMDQTLAAITTTAHTWPQAEKHLIEAAANGHAALNLLDQTIPGLTPITPTGPKQWRATLIQPIAANARIHPPNTPAGHGWATELQNFPHHPHDDQTDATVHAIRHLAHTPDETIYDIG